MITISMRYKNTLTYFFMTAFGSYLSEQAYEKLLDYNWKLTLWSINECLSDFHTSEIAISIDILQGIWLLKQDETGLVYELDTNLARSYRQWSVDLPYDYSLSLVKSTGVNADKPNTKQEMREELDIILNAWNKTFNNNHKYTQTLFWVYIKLRKVYSTDDIILWIKKYILFKKKNVWLTHTFSIYDFLKQKNWFEKYFNS